MKTNLRFSILTALIILSFFHARAQTNSDESTGKEEETTTSRKVNPDASSTAAVPPSSPKTSTKLNKKLRASEDPEVPAGCSLARPRITCSNLTTTPDLKKFTDVTEVYIKSSQLESFNLNLMPLSNLTKLDLSKNKIKTFENSTSKKGGIIQKLQVLNLRESKFENINGGFLTWNFTNLRDLDLSFNPIRELGAYAFNKTAQLQTLKLAYTNLTSIHETTLWPLTQLESLDLSGADIVSHYSSKQFLKNQQLKSLDLSNNQLVEVPAAIRAISSIQNLTLNGNKITSLRQSDFINQTSIEHLVVKNCSKLTRIDEFTFGEMFDLKELTISNNERLNYISKDAFKSETDPNTDVITLSLLDLSGNNISTMSDPKEFTSLKFTNIRLGNNPWHCTCELRWFETLPLNERDPVHCKSPQDYKDLELSQYLLTVNCGAEQSGYHRIIVTCFLVFLFGLAVAVFVQKSEFCRRLLWKDQYGTIYYTKASFPPETA